MGLAVGISLLSEAETALHLVLVAAILNLSFPVSKYGLKSVSDGAARFPDPENMNLVGVMCFVT
jgi:hypothetical protein